MADYRVIRQWADRVRLVRRYLGSPSLWPDGIDTALERWYLGQEDYWRERAGRLVDGRWEGGVSDEVAHALWAGGAAVGRPKAEGVRPWVEAGVSRRTWYRRKAEEEAPK